MANILNGTCTNDKAYQIGSIALMAICMFPHRAVQARIIWHQAKLKTKSKSKVKHLFGKNKHVLCHTQYKIILMKKQDTHENKHEKFYMKNMVNIIIML